MPARNKSSVTYLTVAQLRVLASSERLGIVQRLNLAGPSSARELARFLGQPVTGLYHHLKELERSGLLRIAAQHDTGGRPEASYELASKRLSSAAAVRTPAGRKALLRLATRVVSATMRAFSSAMLAVAARLDGADRNLSIRHVVFRAEKARLAALNAALDRLCTMELADTSEGEAILMTVIVAPAAQD